MMKSPHIHCHFVPLVDIYQANTEFLKIACFQHRGCKNRLENPASKHREHVKISSSHNGGGDGMYPEATKTNQNKEVD